MEAKLKAMKVADLKAVLQQANVAFDSKLTKPGLIKKIMETPEASAMVSADGNPADDDLPDLPPNLNWDEPKSTSAVPATATVASATTAAAPSAAPVASSGPSSATKEDPATAFKADNLPALTLEDEAAKRKARAAKWGTTYVEPTVAGPSTTENKSPSTAKNLSAEELERRKAREARFGVARAQAAPVLDEEEMKKRKAREDRFGANKKPRIE